MSASIGRDLGEEVNDSDAFSWFLAMNTDKNNRSQNLGAIMFACKAASNDVPTYTFILKGPI